MNQTTDFFALAPLVLLAGGSVICLLAGAVRPGTNLHGLAGGLLASALVLNSITPAGPMAPGLAVTLSSKTFSTLIYAAGLVAILFARPFNQRRGISGEEYPATLLFSLAGMSAVSSATNLLMLFLALEAFTFGFYILVVIERDSARGGEAGLKYLLNGTLSAAVMGMGIALVYAARGTLSLTGLAITGSQSEPLLPVGICLILLGLAFKLSLVPAHLWTADVYQGAPPPVTLLLSTTSKGAALAALLHLLPYFAGWRGTHDILWLLALLSMLGGNLAALVQTSLTRMLAWSSIGQMGYVAMALLVVPYGGVSASIFYMAVYVAAGLATFGVVSVLSDKNTRDSIEEYRGVGFRSPLAGAVLTAALFSLAGIPPTGGFMGKFGVFAAALRGGETGLAIIGIFSALVAVYFYLKVVVTLYMQPSESLMELRSPGILEAAALLIPTTATLVLGIYPQPLLGLLSQIKI